MKLQKLNRAFTLIELLVVITIIGILATGAVSIFTSQIQKARDSTRISSLNALKASVEQVYQDTSEYPHSDLFVTEVKVYLENFPSDPKHSQPCNNNASAADVDCWYAYIVWNDANGIQFWTYELSTWFENTWNVTARAEADSWADDLRLEIWIDTGTLATLVAENAITTPDIWACTFAWADAATATEIVIINWNPTDDTVAQCG